MNYSIIIYIIGYILEIEAAFMALPLVTSLIYRETFRICFSHYHHPLSCTRYSDDI